MDIIEHYDSLPLIIEGEEPTMSEKLHVLAAQVVTWPGITELERQKAYHEITLLALRTHF